jgi:hypothetical protein
MLPGSATHLFGVHLHQSVTIVAMDNTSAAGSGKAMVIYRSPCFSIRRNRPR